MSELEKELIKFNLLHPQQNTKQSNITDIFYGNDFNNQFQIIIIKPKVLFIKPSMKHLNYNQ
jgi:hypothetical protein